MKVAIDGPAGAGKSTIAKAVASALGYIYIDTGAMYRAVGLNALRNGVDIKAQPQLAAKLTQSVELDIVPGADGQRIFLGGEDVTDIIRTQDVSMAASDIAVIKEVREKLVSIQRQLAAGKNVVMDGRDIGTHVLPDAQCKIFLTASVAERARRRYTELTAKGEACVLDEICADIEKRDKNDSERRESPLRRADDAVVLDTTELTIDEAVAEAKRIISEAALS